MSIKCPFKPENAAMCRCIFTYSRAIIGLIHVRVHVASIVPDCDARGQSAVYWYRVVLTPVLKEGLIVSTWSVSRYVIKYTRINLK